MTRWPMRAVCRRATATPDLGDKVHRATLHTVAGRARLVREMPDWAELRTAARAARLRALDRREELLAQLTEAFTLRGVHVHRAATVIEARELVTRLVTEVGLRVTKSKSMTSEEVDLNPALEAAGVAVTETDLGELIVQLAGQKPSHVTAPAIHLSIEDIGRLFADHLAMPLPRWLACHEPVAEVERRAFARELALRARDVLRERFLEADVGISGANFLVADSATVVLLENEGNIQLTTCLPRRHIVLAGTDKLLESEADLAVMLRLLPVSATGQRQTCYVSLFADSHPDMHVVLLDHGRRALASDLEQRDLLTCIRCGACMNACPVYRNVGGHAYGGAYPGPIGALLMPLLHDADRYAELPFASSLCGACAESCPVAIPLHRRLLGLRARLTEQGRVRSLGLTLRAATMAMQRPEQVARLPRLYRSGHKLAALVPAGRAWQSTRELPQPVGESFRAWWERERGGLAAASAAASSVPGSGSAPLPVRRTPERDQPPAPSAPSAPSAPEISLLERFAERLAELGPAGETELHPFDCAAEVVRWLRERAAAHPAADVILEGEAAEKRGYQLGISKAQLLIADTGGIVLDFADRPANRVATLVETHVVVGRPSELVRTVADAVSVRAERRAAGTWHGLQVIVTGPSRTADVEKILVIPAHGPRRLVVVLCEQPVDLREVRGAIGGPPEPRIAAEADIEERAGQNP